MCEDLEELEVRKNLIYIKYTYQQIENSYCLLFIILLQVYYILFVDETFTLLSSVFVISLHFIVLVQIVLFKYIKAKKFRTKQDSSYFIHVCANVKLYPLLYCSDQVKPSELYVD